MKAFKHKDIYIRLAKLIKWNKKVFQRVEEPLKHLDIYYLLDLNNEDEYRFSKFTTLQWKSSE